MIDCPENISLEECLKRQLKHDPIKITAATLNHNSAPAPKIKESKSHNSKSNKHGSSTLVSNTTVAAVSVSSNGTHSGGGNSISGGSTISGGGFSGGGGSFASNASHKGGVVVNHQTVIVKTNFEMAGRLNRSGKRPNAKAVGSHASASLNYMDNHGAKDLEENEALSNTFDSNGERMSKEEIEGLKQELNEGIGAFRRTVIDAGHNEFDRDDMSRLVSEAMQEFKEQTGKEFDYVYAVHTNTDHTHAHILSHGESSEINMTKDHLQLFKEIVGDKTNELLHEKELNHDRDLTLNQQIDKAMDGVLDDNEKTIASKSSLTL